METTGSQTVSRGTAKREEDVEMTQRDYFEHTDDFLIWQY